MDNHQVAENIRLLMELEKQAMEKVVRSVRISDNYLRGVVVEVEMAPLSEQLAAHVRFTLNDEEYLTIVTVDPFDNHSHDPTHAAKLLSSALAKKVSEKVYDELLRKFNSSHAKIIGMR